MQRGEKRRPANGRGPCGGGRRIKRRAKRRSRVLRAVILLVLTLGLMGLVLMLATDEVVEETLQCKSHIIIKHTLIIRIFTIRIHLYFFNYIVNAQDITLGVDKLMKLGR